jgi:hypothetical protein
MICQVFGKFLYLIANVGGVDFVIVWAASL